jgi:hypothetical protein
MRIDYRAGNPDPEADDQSYYAVLGTSAEFLFNMDGGNREPWVPLQKQLYDTLPGGYHNRLDDIEITPRGDIILNGTDGDASAAAWFCRNLVERQVIHPSARVFEATPDGTAELGAAGMVAREILDDHAVSFSP